MSLIANTLDKAADLIDQHGWFQVGGDPSHRFCALVAIRAAAPQLTPHQIALREAACVALARYVELDIDRIQSGIIRWNDAPGRTQEEVTAALRGAAEAVRGA